MGRLDGGDNSLGAAQFYSCLHRLIVGGAHELYAAGLEQMGVHRSDARVIEARRNGIRLDHLTVLGLHEQRLTPVEYTRLAQGRGSRRFTGIDSLSCRFDTNEIDMGGIQ